MFKFSELNEDANLANRGFIFLGWKHVDDISLIRLKSVTHRFVPVHTLFVPTLKILQLKLLYKSRQEKKTMGYCVHQ